MVFLKGVRTGEIIQSNRVTLDTETTSYITTKPASSGRFYFEFTHIKGGNNCHFVGYVSRAYQTNSGIFFYQQGSKTTTKLFSGDSINVYYENMSQKLLHWPIIDFEGMNEEHTKNLNFYMLKDFEWQNELKSCLPSD